MGPSGAEGGPAGAFIPAPAPEVFALNAGVALSVPPFRQVHVDWKDRMAQPYVYVEAADAAAFHDAMRQLLAAAGSQGLEPDGAPFGLFHASGAARACLPVATRPSRSAVLGFDLLPGGPVVYAVCSGPYTELAAAHAGLDAYLVERGWRVTGPRREVYLVDPGSVDQAANLVTEIQVPWGR